MRVTDLLPSFSTFELSLATAESLINAPSLGPDFLTRSDDTPLRPRQEEALMHAGGGVTAFSLRPFFSMAGERFGPIAAPAPNAPASAVLLHYPIVREWVMRQLASYCDAHDLKVGKAPRLYLFRLLSVILQKLYEREKADSEFGRARIIHVWIRNDPKVPSAGNVEVDRPGAFVGKPFGKKDILIALVRGDHRNAQVYGYLEHQQTHFETSGNPDHKFVQKLGLWPKKLHIRLDALHLDFGRV